MTTNTKLTTKAIFDVALISVLGAVAGAFLMGGIMLVSLAHGDALVKLSTTQNIAAQNVAEDTDEDDNQLVTFDQCFDPAEYVSTLKTRYPDDYVTQFPFTKTQVAKALAAAKEGGYKEDFDTVVAVFFKHSAALVWGTDGKLCKAFVSTPDHIHNVITNILGQDA
jgi:hypothetical protein